MHALLSFTYPSHLWGLFRVLPSSPATLADWTGTERIDHAIWGRLICILLYTYPGGHMGTFWFPRQETAGILFVRIDEILMVYSSWISHSYYSTLLRRVQSKWDKKCLATHNQVAINTTLNRPSPDQICFPSFRVSLSSRES